MANVPVMFQCSSWSGILKNYSCLLALLSEQQSQQSSFRIMGRDWGGFPSRSQEKKKLESSRFFRSSLWLIGYFSYYVLAFSPPVHNKPFSVEQLMAGCDMVGILVNLSASFHLSLALERDVQGCNGNATLLLPHDQEPTFEKLQKAELLKTGLGEISEFAREISSTVSVSLLFRPQSSGSFLFLSWSSNPHVLWSFLSYSTADSVC